MAISAKMLAVLQAVDIKRAAHFARLRDGVKRDAEAKVQAKKRAALAALARGRKRKD